MLYFCIISLSILDASYNNYINVGDSGLMVIGRYKHMYSFVPFFPPLYFALHFMAEVSATCCKNTMSCGLVRIGSHFCHRSS